MSKYNRNLMYVLYCVLRSIWSMLGPNIERHLWSHRVYIFLISLNSLYTRVACLSVCRRPSVCRPSLCQIFSWNCLEGRSLLSLHSFYSFLSFCGSRQCICWRRPNRIIISYSYLPANEELFSVSCLC